RSPSDCLTGPFVAPASARQIPTTKRVSSNSELPGPNDRSKERHPLAPRDGPEDRDEADREQEPMSPLQQGKGGIRRRACPRVEPSGQNERLSHEQHEGEQQP